ncbi:hypothetical protein IAU60_004469 [Kwoniella sp. DSM 27419]
MSPLAAYHSLLLSNLSTVQTIESGLSNITWLLPGRFEDAELASEGLYALLGLVAGYHDTVLQAHLSPALSLPPHPFAAPRSARPNVFVGAGTSTEAGSTSQRTLPLLPASSDHTRYTRYWCARSPTYRRAARALTTIGYLELVVEMLARRKGGDRIRWRVVLFMESVKTVLRLIIMRITRRPVLHTPTPQRELDPASLPLEILQPETAPSAATAVDDSQVKLTPLTPSLPPHAPLRAHLYPMLENLPEEMKEHPLALLPQLKGKEYIAEIISSTIGLVHVLLLMRAARQPSASSYKSLSLSTLSRSYAPYLLILRLSLMARYLRPSATASASPLLASHNATQDRKLAMRAFLTGPMWLGFTRPRVLGLAKWLERVPIVGLAGDLVEGYLPLVDDYFYYTSS